MADVNPSRTVHGQPRGHSYVALSDTSTTVLAKTGRGLFHALTLTGGTAGAVVVYDNTEASGTIIASFSEGAIGQSGVEGTVKAELYTFDVDFTTGLTVSTTAVDTPRLTVTYI